MNPEISDICSKPEARLFAAFMPFPSHELTGNALLVNKFLGDDLTNVMVKRFYAQANKTRYGTEEITKDVDSAPERD